MTTNNKESKLIAFGALVPECTEIGLEPSHMIRVLQAVRKAGYGGSVMLLGAVSTKDGEGRAVLADLAPLKVDMRHVETDSPAATGRATRFGTDDDYVIEVMAPATVRYNPKGALPHFQASDCLFVDGALLTLLAQECNKHVLKQIVLRAASLGIETWVDLTCIDHSAQKPAELDLMTWLLDRADFAFFNAQVHENRQYDEIVRMPRQAAIIVHAGGLQLVGQCGRELMRISAQWSGLEPQLNELLVGALLAQQILSAQAGMRGPETFFARLQHAAVFANESAPTAPQ